MANLKMKPKPKPDPEPKTRSVLHPNPIPTLTTTPITSLAVSAAFIFAGSLSGTLHSLPLAATATATATATPKSITISNGTPIIFIQLIELVNKLLVILSDNSLFFVDFELQTQIKKLGVVKVAGGGKITSVSRKFDTRDNPNNPALFSPNGVGTDSIGSSFVGGNRDLGNGDDVKCSFVIGVGKKIVFLDVNCSRGEFAVVREVTGVGLEKVGMIVGLIWVGDSVIVGSKSGYHLFSCKTGKCSVLFNLPEVESVPRMKLLRRDGRGRVILVVDNVGIVVDVEGQPVGGSLVFRGVPEGVGEVGMYVVVVRGGMVEVYHKKSGRCVQVILLGEARNGSCIVSESYNDNGSFVVLASGTKVICYQKVPAEEQIKDLLRKKGYREAVALMEELESEGELSKEMVSFIHAQVGFLLLFDLHFEDAIDHFLSSETMQPSEVFPLIMRDPNRWSLLVPRNRYWCLHPPPVPLENVIDDGLKSIQKAAFLKKAGVEAAVDDESLLNPPNKADLMESAIKSMIRYLKVSRNKELVASLREGVDTLLMYLYRSLNHVDDMEILASSENFCVVEELETLLNESGHLRTLAFLYASKGMNSKALSIWRLLARNPSSSQKSVAENDLHDASSNAAAIEASRILEESSDQDLVVQHMGWIADIDQVLAIHVLISDKRVNMLSPDEIISAIDPKKVEILQRYLQWLIEDQDSDDARFHTMYAVLLAKSALEVCVMESGHLPKMNDSASERASIFESPVRERLQIFLQSSDFYDPEEVLELIAGSNLWLEKAILYRKLGQETRVLQILALKLEDCEAAENYCEEIGRPDAYMQLLEMYLYPENRKEPMLKAAVRLLHNHGEFLDPLQILERLSPDISLQRASETILRLFRARLHHHRRGQIVHNISRALDVDARLAISEERSRHVLINDESTCASCHARLGTKLFAMYPDDTVVCYKCYRRQGEYTSVTGRDFTQDVLHKPGWLVTR